MVRSNAEEGTLGGHKGLLPANFTFARRFQAYNARIEYLRSV